MNGSGVRASGIQRLVMIQRFLDLADELGEFGFGIGLRIHIARGIEQLVRDVECRNDRDALQTDDFAGAAYLAHFSVQILAGGAQAFLFIFRAIDAVGLVQNEDFERTRFGAHEYSAYRWSGWVIPEAFLRCMADLI